VAALRTGASARSPMPPMPRRARAGRAANPADDPHRQPDCAGVAVELRGRSAPPRHQTVRRRHRHRTAAGYEMISATRDSYGAHLTCCFRRRRGAVTEAEEVGDQCFSAFTEHRLRMELHTPPGTLPVAHPHQATVVLTPGQGLQHRWQSCGIDREAVVPDDRERLRQAGKGPGPAVTYPRGLAVTQLRRRSDAGPQQVAEHLMAEADSEDGELRRSLQDRRADPRLLRASGAG